MANKLTGDYASEKIDVNGQMAATLALIAELQRREGIVPEGLTVSDDPEVYEGILD